jgi:hypothetical protein
MTAMSFGLLTGDSDGTCSALLLYEVEEILVGETRVVVGAVADEILDLLTDGF